MTSSAPPRPRVGVSACLLGEKVRYDGGHRRCAWLVEELAARVEFVPVCPENEAGLGVPREEIRIELRDGSLRVHRIEDGVDLTARLEAWIEPRLDAWAKLNLAGCVFKANSPSCGIESVPVFDRTGEIVAAADGVFASALRARWPDLPVVDDFQLETEEGRRRFERAVNAYAGRNETGP